MPDQIVPAVVEKLYNAFADDPALQHALLGARTLADVRAALSQSIDACVELNHAAAARDSSATARANARDAAGAREHALQLVETIGQQAPASGPARQRPMLRVVSSQ